MTAIKRLRITSLLIIILMASCGDYEPSDGETGSYQRFDWDIQGTWTTNDPDSRYKGTLIIDYKRITITGYGENQTPVQGGDDTERPFRNFAKGVALEGYSTETEETNEKVLIIKDAGTWQEAIPYTYWEGTRSPPNYNKVEFIRFTFGGRQETLQKEILQKED